MPTPPWSARSSETSLPFVIGASPIVIARVQRKRDGLSSQTRPLEMPAMARHIGRLRLSASHSSGPLDDFYLQRLACDFNCLYAAAQNGALRQLVSQADRRS